MDFADFDIRLAEEGQPMTVMMPDSKTEPFAADGEPPPVLILAGKDSSKFRRGERELITKRQQASSKNNGFVPWELVESEDRDQVIACLVGWEHVVLDGKPLEFSAHNARKLLGRCPFVVEQAISFIRARSNFLKDLPNGLSE